MNTFIFIFISLSLLITTEKCYLNMARVFAPPEICGRIRDSYVYLVQNVMYFFHYEASKRKEKLLSFIENWKMYAEIRRRKVSCLSD